MSRYIAVFLICFITATASAGEGKSSQSAPSKAEIRQQYAATLTEAAKEQSEVHTKNLEIMASTEAMLTRREDMMKRQEEDVARFEKIMDTWERQQAQYEKYLNSLDRKLR